MLFIGDINDELIAEFRQQRKQRRLKTVLKNLAIGAGVLGLGVGAIKVGSFLRKGKLVRAYTRSGRVGSEAQKTTRTIPDPGNPRNPINHIRDDKYPESLTLVLNAQDQSLVELLASKSNWSQQDAQDLFTRTSFLNASSSKNFRESGRKALFDERTADGSFSEYDAVFVWIGLKEKIAGFQPNALLIDRSDAFRKLITARGEMVVSPVRSSQGYSGRGFYNR